MIIGFDLDDTLIPNHHDYSAPLGQYVRLLAQVTAPHEYDCAAAQLEVAFKAIDLMGTRYAPCLDDTLSYIMEYYKTNPDCPMLSEVFPDQAAK
jgi:FMN phosphatase YigB (HAD superfamily)